VSGLKSKRLLSDFEETINQFDCTETHLDEFDTISLNNYSFVAKNRGQKFTKKSGGIGMYIKSSIYDKCMFHDTECEYVQWCQLSKSLLNSDEDLMLGVVYIPPANTRYFKQNIVDFFYAELESFTSSHTNVLLMGVII